MKPSKIISSLLIGIIGSLNIFQVGLAAEPFSPITGLDQGEQRRQSSPLNIKPSPSFTDPALCPTGSPASHLFTDNMEGALQWDFGSISGVGHWGISASGPYISPTHSLFGPDEPTQVDSYAVMKNSVLLPNDTSAYLYFHHQFDLEKYTAGDVGYDGGVIEYSADGGAWTDIKMFFSAGQDYNMVMSNTGSGLAGRLAFSGNSNGWVVSRYDLSNLAGKSVRFRWRTASDGEFAKTGWYIDDVDIYTCATNTNVFIGGILAGSYNIPTGGSIRQSYAQNNGPVKTTATGTSILAAQRILYYANSVPTSFVETMGLPTAQLDTTYWFPWYKNDGIVDTQIRIGNVSGSTATVHIYIGGVEVAGSPFTLTASGAGQSQRLSFILNDGPVKIVSDQNIVASERLIYFNSGVPISFSEMLGLPNSQLSTTYWFPWYKNVGDGIDTQLRIGNVSGAAASVHVYIGGVEMAGSPFALTATGAGQSLRLNFTANNGPVKIVSDQNIVAAQRILYYAGGVPTSFVETMGIPNSQLGTTQWFPWYKNDGIVDTQIRIGNVSGVGASVHVYIGTAEMVGSPFPLTATGAGQSLRLSFTANDGPVKIVSDQNIVTSERLIYFLNGTPISFSEMMGLPHSQLSTTYWLPWYKNVGEIDTQLRVGRP